MRTATAAGVLALFAGAAGATSDESMHQQDASATSDQQQQQQQQVAAADAAQPAPFDVFEFRIDGAEHLVQVEVERAVYPFLGPQRTPQDIEKARAALEKAYHDKGLQTVSVSVPQQNVEAGIVVLVVTEGKVGKLRVKNSRYFDQDTIKKTAKSLHEGVLPNFNDVTKDIIALNQWPDRRVTPALRAGVTPGTVDVDLSVEDKLPVHASVELNNRQSPNTTPLRLNTSVRYDNLWQRGHSVSLSYQTSPERRNEVEVFSGSYLARLTDTVSLLAYGVDSSSNVATVGGMHVVGPGQILGSRALITLPSLDGFYHSLSFGLDYKNFGQIVQLGSDSFSSPITYYPVSGTYSATWQGEKTLTQANFGATMNWRGPGSGFEEFWTKRAYAASNFFHANADVHHTRELERGFQLYGKAQTQISDGALISSEQFSIGGWDSVRGYLESEAIGDTGISGSIELRSPDIAALVQKRRKEQGLEEAGERQVLDELRLFAFADAGTAMIYSPLPDQETTYLLWSVGVGARFKMLEYLDGSVALAVPMTDQLTTTAHEPRLLFSVTGGF